MRVDSAIATTSAAKGLSQSPDAEEPGSGGLPDFASLLAALFDNRTDRNGTGATGSDMQDWLAKGPQAFATARLLIETAIEMPLRDRLPIQSTGPHSPTELRPLAQPQFQTALQPVGPPSPNTGSIGSGPDEPAQPPSVPASVSERSASQFDSFEPVAMPSEPTATPLPTLDRGIDAMIEGRAAAQSASPAPKAPTIAASSASNRLSMPVLVPMQIPIAGTPAAQDSEIQPEPSPEGRAVAPSQSRAGAASVTQIDVRWIATEGGPLVLMRIPRITPEERRELETRIQQLLASLGHKRAKLAFRETTGA